MFKINLIITCPETNMFLCSGTYHNNFQSQIIFSHKKVHNSLFFSLKWYFLERFRLPGVHQVACKPLLKIVVSYINKIKFVDVIRFGWCNFFLEIFPKKSENRKFWLKMWNFLYFIMIYRRRWSKKNTLEGVPPHHLDKWLILWKSRENRHFQKWPKIKACWYFAKVWCQRVQKSNIVAS